MSSTVSIWTKSSLSSFPTHQHRHASMERMRQAGQKWRRGDPLVALTTSPTGRNDPVGPEERAPHAGTPQADGIQGAVPDGVTGKRELAHRLEVLDGEGLAVDICCTRGVAPGECICPLRGIARDSAVIEPPWEVARNLSGEQSPVDDECDGNHAVVGGHDGPFLLISAWSAARELREYGAFLMHTRRGLGCQVKIFSSPVKISSRVCLLVKVRFQARICSTCQ